MSTENKERYPTINTIEAIQGFHPSVTYAYSWMIFHVHVSDLSRIFKRLWSSGIDSKEWIPPAYVAWRAGTITLFLLSA
jgi:hypothetical protein